MDLLDKLRVILHEEGDGLHQLRLSERRHLAAGWRRDPVVDQAGARALSWSPAGESLDEVVGSETGLSTKCQPTSGERSFTPLLSVSSSLCPEEIVIRAGMWS